MELRQLRQFYEVCERGSFSAAGESLYMTQQAIGKSMKQLEDELAVVLFTREKAGVLLTPQGEYLRERCRVLLDYIRETEDGVRAIGAHCPLRTRISLPGSVLEEIRAINEQNVTALYETPFLEIRIEDDDAGGEILKGDHCDALILPTFLQSEGIMTYPLLHVPLCAVFSKESREFQKKELAIRDFRNQRVILPSNWIYMRRSLERVFREQNIQVQEIISVASREEGLALAENKQGIFVLTEEDMRNYEIGHLRLMIKPIKKRSFSWNLYYSFRKNDTCQKEILRAYEFLKIRLLR